MHAHFVNDLSIRTRIWDWVCRASVCSVALSTRHAMEVATNHELHRRHFPDLIAPSHCCHYLLDHRLLDMIELNDRFWRFYCRALFIDVVAIFFDNKSPYYGLCDVTTRLLLLCDIMRRLPVLCRSRCGCCVTSCRLLGCVSFNSASLKQSRNSCPTCLRISCSQSFVQS